ELNSSQRIMAVRFNKHGTKLLVFFESTQATQEPKFKFFVYDIDSHTQADFIGSHAVVDGQATLYDEYIVTWDGSGDLVFWDMETHKEIAVLNVAPNAVYDVSFPPSGDVVATAGDDGQVKFFDIASRQRLKTNEFKHSSIDLLQIDPLIGRLMVTGSD